MPEIPERLIDQLIVPPGKEVSLARDFDPGWTPESVTKTMAAGRLEEGVKLLAEYQGKLYAQDTYALLVIFQALDAAGKDGTIKHVLSGVNPQGCQVYSFKAPSAEEMDHDYLWRCSKRLPERGRIGIFNRSYYEEVLVARVHPQIIGRQKLPARWKDKHIWKRRFQEINNFEEYLTHNGIEILKFYLNISRKEQKKRFLDRIDRPDKNWKFSDADVRERAHWDQYIAAYEECMSHTSTEWAPWYVIPADNKWATRLAVSHVICRKLESLNLAYPEISGERREALQAARRQLEGES